MQTGQPQPVIVCSAVCATVFAKPTALVLTVCHATQPCHPRDVRALAQPSRRLDVVAALGHERVHVGARRKVHQHTLLC